MARPSVLVLQHIACESPALIAETLRTRGVRLEFVRVHRGDRVPRRLGAHAGLVVMGGPMSAYDQDRLAHLRAEIALIRNALAEGKPILGICLGSQLLAAALGATVACGPRKEIGWYPVTLSAAAKRDPLWRGLPREFTPLHWHGDVFDLPKSAVSLARSALTRHQAFRFGQNAYGFLFHLELKPAGVRRWSRVFRRERQGAGVTTDDLEAGIRAHAAATRRIGETVFDRWTDLLGSA